jgi:hypothetical protein
MIKDAATVLRQGTADVNIIRGRKLETPTMPSLLCSCFERRS